MKTKSLFRLILKINLLWACGVSFILLIILFGTLSKINRDAQKFHLEKMMVLSIDALRPAIQIGNRYELINLVQSWIANNNLIAARLDIDGMERIEVYSSENHVVDLLETDPGGLGQSLFLSDHWSFAVDLPVYQDHDGARIRAHFVASNLDFRKALLQALAASIFIGCFILGLSAYTAWRANRKILKPLNDFSLFMKSFDADEVRSDSSLLTSANYLQVEETKLLFYQFVELQTRLTDSRKRIEELRVKEALGDMALSVSHDLRSPLVALEAVLMELNQSDDVRKLLSVAVDRLKRIVSDLLTEFKNKDAQDCTTNLQSLPEIFERIRLEKIQEFKNPPWGFKIEALSVLPTSGARISMSRGNLERVLSNFLTNAFEASGALDVGPELSFQIVDQNLVIKIIDYGEGISSEDLTRFGKTQFTTKKRGYGLGVKNSVDMVESSGGRLEIFSKKAEGTIITIYLPILYSAYSAMARP